jgi:hypothetical protein
MCSPQRPVAFFTSLPDSLAGRHVGKQRGEAPAMVVVLCCAGLRPGRQRNRENRCYCDATEKRLLPRLPRLNALSNLVRWVPEQFGIALSTRTTQLYDRRRDEVSLDELERIVI